MDNPQPSPKLLKYKDILSNMGVIYCLESPNGKYYIGQTKRLIKKRIREHSIAKGGCLALNNAIHKYGFNLFKIEILLEVNDELLDFYEVKFIDSYDSMYPNGYNIRSGGNTNSKHCEESRERIRKSKLGDKNPNFGKPRSENTKLSISEAKSGEKHHFYGKNLSESHKLKLSASHKSDITLEMYLVRVKERPGHYTSSGYAIINHPYLKNKYFTSKKITDAEKLNLAKEYLKNGNMDAVQRLNVDGSSSKEA
jgi:group I intron endonuclease